jgi:hypothetical protein
VALHLLWWWLLLPLWRLSVAARALARCLLWYVCSVYFVIFKKVLWSATYCGSGGCCCGSGSARWLEVQLRGAVRISLFFCVSWIENFFLSPAINYCDFVFYVTVTRNITM